MLHLPDFSYPLTFSTFHLIKSEQSRVVLNGWVVDGCGCWNTPSRQVVGKLSNTSWIGWKETKIFE
jgi:hypothetical protein